MLFLSKLIFTLFFEVLDVRVRFFDACLSMVINSSTKKTNFLCISNDRTGALVAVLLALELDCLNGVMLGSYA